MECTYYLRQYTECLNNDSYTYGDDIYVSTLDQKSTTQVSIILQLVNNPIVSPQCLINLEPFICLHFIHICYDDNDTLVDVGPSKNQCRHIEEVCDMELKFAQEFFKLNFSEYLSNCDPHSAIDRKACSTQSNPVGVNNTCSEGFYKNTTTNRSCLPQCIDWSPYSKNTVLITDVLAIFSTVVAVVSGVAVLFVSCVRCQKM